MSHLAPRRWSPTAFVACSSVAAFALALAWAAPRAAVPIAHAQQPEAPAEQPDAFLGEENGTGRRDGHQHGDEERHDGEQRKGRHAECDVDGSLPPWKLGVGMRRRTGCGRAGTKQGHQVGAGSGDSPQIRAVDAQVSSILEE